MMHKSDRREFRIGKKHKIRNLFI
uniref:Uncharacterized protein n=1 Tax=Anguilla anguilla TaxID=7936 RepID=A0A0E9QAQ4_ANGAN